MPKLYVLSGPDVGKSFEVASGALIGRDAECTVRLRDPSVSRHHARIEHGPAGWSIVDTQSRNGIHAAGQRVPSVHLDDGAEITLGEVLLRFRSEVASAEVAAPRARPEPIAASPSIEEEIVLEGDWEEREPAAMAQTVFAPQASPPAPKSLPAAPNSPPAAEGAFAGARSAMPVSGGVAHRAAGPVSASRSVLQYQRIADRPGFFNSDLSQQPVWLKLALALLALAVFAAVFWFAFQGTSFLKSKTQHESGDAQTEENG
jgi:predicted component of type VI protein secretion system